MQDEVLKGFYYRICIGYLDDVMPFAKDLVQHFGNLRCIFDRYRKYNIKVNLMKTSLVKLDCLWCGRVFSHKGVALNPEFLKAIERIHVPATAQSLQQFYCSVNWLRPSILNFAVIVAPLQALLEKQYALANGKRTKRALKNKPIVGWNEEHSKAVDAIKDALKRNLVRAFPDSDMDRNVLMDASLDFWSLLITQTAPEEANLPINERRHQLLYIQSGRFVNSQVNWHKTSKEAFPFIQAVRSAHYLLGCKFHVYTDHKNLLAVFQPDGSAKRHTIERLTRWALELGNYDYVIHHLEGRLNILPDYLSRPPPVILTSMKRLRFF